MVRKDYISWDEFFMKVSEAAAERSKDPKTQVGCTIRNDRNHIVGVGYNGMPVGMEDDDEVWDDEDKHLYVVHAEANAILNSTEDLTGSIAYVTLFPCNECSKLIVQSGIKEVVYKDNKFEGRETHTASSKILKDGGVKVRRY